MRTEPTPRQLSSIELNQTMVLNTLIDTNLGSTTNIARFINN
jgi:hypothetical protein